MATSNYNSETRFREDIPDCNERDNATQLTINDQKKIYCQNLKDDESNIQILKIGYESNERIYKSKERRFLSTGDNYQRYLNTEVSMGSQLVQANEKLKANVGNYKAWDDSLAKSLKDIFATVKTAKAKMSDLRDAASKLENSRKDSCNMSQWNLITGKIEKEKEKEKEEKPPATRAETEACRDVEEAIEMIFCMPKALSADVDSIFKSSSDTIGIQKFCNTGSLVPLHQTLYTNVQDFDTLLINTIVVRKADLEARQQELKEALKNRTGFVMDLYTLRNDYASIHTTLKKICCPTCGCVVEELGNCEARLEKCENGVCEICGEVRIILTKEETQQEQQQ